MQPATLICSRRRRYPAGNLDMPPAPVRIITSSAVKTQIPMDWITDQIAIGDYREAQDASLLRQHKFGSVLGLISTLRGTEPASLGVKRIEVVELLDGPGNDPARF